MRGGTLNHDIMRSFECVLPGFHSLTCLGPNLQQPPISRFQQGAEPHLSHALQIAIAAPSLSLPIPEGDLTFHLSLYHRVGLRKFCFIPASLKNLAVGEKNTCSATLLWKGLRIWAIE